MKHHKKSSERSLKFQGGPPSQQKIVSFLMFPKLREFLDAGYIAKSKIPHSGNEKLHDYYIPSAGNVHEASSFLYCFLSVEFCSFQFIQNPGILTIPGSLVHRSHQETYIFFAVHVFKLLTVRSNECTSGNSPVSPAEATSSGPSSQAYRCMPLLWR